MPKDDESKGLSLLSWRAITFGTVVALVVTFHLPVYLTYRDEQQAIAEVRALGGHVEMAGREPPWLLARLGSWYGRFFDRVSVVDLAGTGATDADLAHLAGLTDLLWLKLSGTQVTNSGLLHLARLTGLARLDLDGTQVTDAGLAHLAGLTSLVELDLERTQVTDAGLAHLTGLTDLDLLHLLGTQVTDAGLDHLAGLTGLRWLGLWGTQVTEAGVADLQRRLPGADIRR